MLWDQTKDLPKDRFKVVENIYAEAGCPIEVRLHLANFVESSFMTNEQVDERTAIGLAKQLIIELDAKIDALNDPDRVLDKRKLHELSDNLKVSSISSFLSENILVSKLNWIIPQFKMCLNHFKIDLNHNHFLIQFVLFYNICQQQSIAYSNFLATADILPKLTPFCKSNTDDFPNPF